MNNSMKKIILAALISWFISFSSLAATCPDLIKLKQIGKELATDFKSELCRREITSKQIEWLQKQALPQIMTKSFLGVEPPPNWELMAEELIRDCFQFGNLCLKKVQNEVTQCLLSKMPVLMLQYGGWFADHCEKVDSIVLQNWNTKKVIIERLLLEFQGV